MGSRFAKAKEADANDAQLYEAFKNDIEEAEKYIKNTYEDKTLRYTDLKNICFREFNEKTFAPVRKNILQKYARENEIITDSNLKNELCDKIVKYHAGKIMLLQNLVELKNYIKNKDIRVSGSFMRKLNPMITKLKKSLDDPLSADDYNRMQRDLRHLFTVDFLSSCSGKDKTVCKNTFDDIMSAFRVIDDTNREMERNMPRNF